MLRIQDDNKLLDLFAHMPTVLKDLLIGILVMGAMTALMALMISLFGGGAVLLGGVIAFALVALVMFYLEARDMT